MIKQRIMLTEMPEVKWNLYMRSHNSGNIHGEILHIWAVERTKSFLENYNFFHKNYTTHRSENEFWATCHNISNLFDGCWHPLLRFIKNITYPEALIVYTCSKVFSVMAWDWGQNRSLQLVPCVFSVWSNKKCRRLTKLLVNTKIK